jgi:hypothetical protein
MPLDYIQTAFGVGIGVMLSEDASGITYSALMTFDDMGPDSFSYVSISQTTTVVTVTDPSLPLRGGVVAGDIVHIMNSGVAAGVDGWYVVASTPSTTTYTVTSGTSQSVTGGSNSRHQYFRMFAAPAALTAATTRASAALSHSTTGPVTGVALNVTAYAAGRANMVVVQGVGT